jgi:diaminohydroxyphosphoribosylaminopyrimidine deaminase / 5-amino-6-(5-phosphoribosylamino)uracil reductase
MVARRYMELITSGTETIAGLPVPASSTEDERFMLQALELAEKGRRTASPNPVVGCVVVSEGRVAGAGFHERAGEPHAEVNALRVAGPAARGATLYVTLEPCSHHGRTPPCVEGILEAGVGRVVVAAGDPNPLVGGEGLKRLREGGVDVVRGPFAELAARQNEAYWKWITSARPFVTLKSAVSFDGKVATRTRDSRWVTSEEARRDVHELRAACDAVMVGIGTVMADDPRLTARDVGECQQPLRVVIDTLGRTPAGSKVADIADAPTLIAVSGLAAGRDTLALEEKGVRILRSGAGDKVDLAGVLDVLGREDVTSVLCEGGPTLAAGLWQEGLADKLIMYVAPKVVGGSLAPGPIGGEGIELMADAAALELDSVSEIGADLKIVAYPGGRL